MREILWTEESEQHIWGHQVAPQEVEQVLYASPRLIAPGRGGSTLVFGTTAANRHLLVVLAEAMDGRWYVVTAREMTAGERRVFARKAR